MTLAFPDNAPSRYKVARRTAGIRNLEQRVRDAREQGLEDDPSKAAEEILVLVTALSNHDKRTRGHSERTHLFTAMLSDELKLSKADRDRLTWAAMVHDIGKLEVRAETLNKPGKPDEAEWEELRSHPGHGARICEPLRPWLGEWYDAIGHHHERWDGTGYPGRLAGTDISYGGRIVAVADAYEVITAARSYKKAMSPEEARKELVRSAGSHFDPTIVRAFLNISLGRLRWAAGPLSWLSNMPFFEGAVPLLGRVPSAVRTAVGAASALTLGVTSGVLPGMAATIVTQSQQVVEASVPVESALPLSQADGVSTVVDAPVGVAGESGARQVVTTGEQLTVAPTPEALGLDAVTASEEAEEPPASVVVRPEATQPPFVPSPAAPSSPTLDLPIDLPVIAPPTDTTPLAPSAEDEPTVAPTSSPVASSPATSSPSSSPTAQPAPSPQPGPTPQPVPEPRAGTIPGAADRDDPGRPRGPHGDGHADADDHLNTHGDADSHAHGDGHAHAHPDAHPHRHGAAERRLGLGHHGRGHPGGDRPHRGHQ
nr:HD domain-containing phosphohydrolase [Euzebya rosea]